ncbi:hypothetical protein AGABI1DRAFT_127944 [Agaricus bisporus var. burnettii JB137-S8]|uniref:General negative regulator of transcription subunit n=1 Tax=Agaricus bisporus var. burnettii (strain JB137-S8 / ATCC MYA-4627 / FGSC 10392) TaxID=597362 RepID=K5XY58_AGABU|nr:uncharacterized protein AGABI1DRAFT_127944 [Agaricus bisporus var. burnettii JB137-S8]EKM80265.1 hypothetical protein AGABI1DRAFT_127944 [Agaricus bisporus var. burnettii JB137-S8]
MAARKLQTEIDRTLKKVSEGVELFESIYEKMQASTNQTQKEKLELDLKTQIKKLQRLRDQIKTWVASNDIKDKSQLLDNRRLIETQMEKFKACEKEMKTKAFSKEGLIQATKLDPKEQEKEEATQWLQSQVEELQMQIESAEAEVESLQGTGKKRNKQGSNAGRLEALETLNERRKWHISRLELVLRLLNNGSLTTDRVLGLKEDVQYFVESNTEEDFEEDEGIYDELNLEEEEEKFGLVADEDESSSSDSGSEDKTTRPAKKHEEESVSSGKRDDSPILKKAAVTLQLRKHSLDTKPAANLNFSQSMSSVVKAPVPKPPQLPPIKYATVAQAMTQSSQQSHVPTASSSTTHLPATSQTQTSPSAAVTSPLVPPPSSMQDHSSISASSPSLTHPSVISPILSSAASVSHQPDGSTYSAQDSPVSSDAVPAKTQSPPSPQKVAAVPKYHIDVASSTDQPQQQVSNDSQPALSQTAPGLSPLPQQVQQIPSTTRAKSPPQSVTPGQPIFPPGVKVAQGEQQQQPAIGYQRPLSSAPQQQTRSSASSAFPGSLQDLVVSFENVKQKASVRMNNLDQVHKMLEGGYTSMPQPQDTEKQVYFTAPYYPQTPHPLLNTAAIFSQLDVETLFYVFYYLPGTYQQHLAAKELKRQSWRFHVKYLTWFQRHSEPQAITDEYEQGVYVYFDWEGSWCQRKKSDFRFEYRYLED